MSEQESKNLETAKAEKPAEKKENFFVRAAKGMTKWFRELKSEAKKVIWPNSKQVINNTVVVFVVAAIVMVVVYLMDVTFGTVRDLIIQLVH